MTEDSIAQIEKTFTKSNAKRVEALSVYIGKKIGYLTVLGFVGSHPKRKTIAAKFKCDCGNMAIIAFSDVKRGHSSSCGCRMQSRSIIHGEASSLSRKATKEYLVWLRLRGRVPCEEICERWLDNKTGYLTFLEDMGRRPERCVFERRDKSKPYDKSNCYWKPMKPKRLRKPQIKDAEFYKNCFIKIPCGW